MSPRSKIVSLSSDATAALELYIELHDSQPLIHRSVLVPASITLPKLHVTLLWGMGWMGHSSLGNLTPLAFSAQEKSATQTGAISQV